MNLLYELHNMSYECVPIPSLIRTFGLQYLTMTRISLHCLLVISATLDGTQAADQVAPPMEPMLQVQPMQPAGSQGAGHMQCRTLYDILDPSGPTAFYIRLWIPSDSTIRIKKRRISVNQNELALPVGQHQISLA